MIGCLWWLRGTLRVSRGSLVVPAGVLLSTRVRGLVPRRLQERERERGMSGRRRRGGMRGLTIDLCSSPASSPLRGGTAVLPVVQ